MQFSLVEIILYVTDQQKSAAFYTGLLQQAPVLDVPGMTEFMLGSGCKLGLMPETGIAKILSDKTPHPATGTGIPRCELYLLTENPEEAYQNALKVGAKPVSPVELRSWGDIAGYVADPDGHIIVFAGKG